MDVYIFGGEMTGMMMDEMNGERGVVSFLRETAGAEQVCFEGFVAA